MRVTTPDLRSCAYDNCGAPSTFVAENTDRDRWGLCDSHLTRGLKVMAPNAPLRVEPIFNNWRGDVDV